MKTLTSTLQHLCRRPGVLTALLLGMASAVIPNVVMAQYYGGPGILGGIFAAQAVGGVSGNSIYGAVLGLLLGVLYFMGFAAVVVIVIAGIYMVVSVGDESAKDKAKKIILYAIVGLIIIAVAAGIVSLIINATGGGGIFGWVPNIGAGNSPNAIRNTILNILLAVLLFMGLAAVVVIVIAGMYMVFSLGDEQAKDRAKRIITYAVIGLIIIALASAIVVFVINATGAGNIFGEVPTIGGGSNDIRGTVLSILRGILNFMALAAVVVIVIAGIILVISLGDEQAKDRAKRIILYAVIGLLIILFASAIVGLVQNLATN